MKRSRRSALLVVLAVVVAAVAAIGGYAYFSASGSGTGSATVGSASAITLSSALVGTLYPGGADVPVTVNVSNPGSGSQHVGTVSGSVATNGGCLGSWFQVDSVAVNATLAGGGSTTAGTNVRMLDSGTNQNACQGLSMTINWSSN